MDSECPNYQHENISWLKLAVAVAILRSKPPELSARKYTENIQAQYLSSQTLLQDQYHIAKMQIRHLEQTLAMSSSMHAKEPASCTHESQQTKDIVIAGTGVGDDFRDVSMLENYKFMHSTMELQGLASLKSVVEADRLLNAAVTHIHTLRSVIDRDVMVISEVCMCKGAESIMVVIDSVQWIGDRPEFMQEVCSFVESIINKLVQPSSYGHSQVLRQKRALVNMLVVFMKGKLAPLLSSILESLVEFTETFCTQLKMSQLSSEAVDPDLYNSGYFVMHCLELTMKMWSKECHIHMSNLQEAQTKLDKVLMLITHCFPLVAQALMRITSLMEAILQDK